ncbi:MAG: acetyl-CoA carboxylase carboxyltransferase subunit alpha [Proteobacteria bacterium]|jgi:acetyl-CoA carboxylase carboxyl transferase subunit alpha|nr:acetyl-CoA carboxylase carboxyltransferase subunit alpha [Pseudomonadota bacterium]MDA0941815.1 acetyl-CoA carboxylase carboxyltransferase subunit alpha [Pseudomonadota bacterium]MDA1034612.1 acetyl-CoA carboxylase carboxyltransferase subunit alpha [Pseudomonadota bacterium]
MKLQYLEFEKPLQDLVSKVEELENAQHDNPKLNIAKEIKQLQSKRDNLLHEIYNQLNAWQISQVSRHPQRPYTNDYIDNLFTDFQELHGDRTFADDAAIIGGLANFEEQPVMVVGQQKGRDTKERQYRNFGMPKPEGYRKALRLFRLAEKFNLPVITLIDTPGAYPGIDAEARGQSEAIARNLYAMTELRTPIIGIVIGEGGSGGALALGVVDHLMMLQFSTYSVISPEGCASILYNDAKKADIAAESLGITAEYLKKVGLIDEIIPEPLGGAHRNFPAMMQSVKQSLSKQLNRMQKQPIDILLSIRYQRLMSYGDFES